MRRVTLWFLSTVAVVVLLFSYRTSTMGAAAAGPAADLPVGDDLPSGSAAPSDDVPSPGGAVSPGKSVDGSVVATRFGPVQVRIIVQAGRITEVTAVQHPAGNPRSDQINAGAMPRLRAEALTAQSADIDTVSGATYSSNGYRESLQAAIDKARP